MRRVAGAMGRGSDDKYDDISTWDINLIRPDEQVRCKEEKFWQELKEDPEVERKSAWMGSLVAVEIQNSSVPHHRPFHLRKRCNKIK